MNDTTNKIEKTIGIIGSVISILRVILGMFGVPIAKKKDRKEGEAA